MQKKKTVEADAHPAPPAVQARMLMLQAEVEGDARAVTQTVASVAASLSRASNPAADLVETIDRARGVIHALEACSEELARLEQIPPSDADDINALSGARGFVARARNMLRARFA